MKKKLPELTFPLSLETVNRFGFSTVVNLLLHAAQRTATLCRVQVAIGEARDDDERELGAGLRKILSEMVTPKKKAKRAASKSARTHSRGNKP